MSYPQVWTSLVFSSVAVFRECQELKENCSTHPVVTCIDSRSTSRGATERRARSASHMFGSGRWMWYYEAGVPTGDWIL